jgi:hypothetical protein
MEAQAGQARPPTKYTYDRLSVFDNAGQSVGSVGIFGSLASCEGKTANPGLWDAKSGTASLVRSPICGQPGSSVAQATILQGLSRRCGRQPAPAAGCGGGWVLASVSLSWALHAAAKGKHHRPASEVLYLKLTK